MRNPPNSREGQQGIVIVVALFIIALVTVMSYAMMARLDRDTARTTMLLRSVQAENFAQGSLVWAIDTLQSHAASSPRTEYIDEIPIKSPTTKIKGFQIISTIDDMQSRFNLNNLAEKNGPQVGMFITLMRIVDPDLKVEDATKIAKAAADWVNTSSDNEALDDYYLKLPVPYRAAHRLMSHVSELKLVKGMTPALYDALKPYIIALPGPTEINIQTAPAPVLMSLNPDITPSIAEAIIGLRKQDPFKTRSDFLAIKILPEGVTKQMSKNITVTSSFFLVETEVSIDQQKLLLYTLLQREQNGGKVKILWQSKGSW